MARGRTEIAEDLFHTCSFAHLFQSMFNQSGTGVMRVSAGGGSRGRRTALGVIARPERGRNAIAYAGLPDGRDLPRRKSSFGLGRRLLQPVQSFIRPRQRASGRIRWSRRLRFHEREQGAIVAQRQCMHYGRPYEGPYLVNAYLQSCQHSRMRRSPAAGPWWAPGNPRRPRVFLQRRDAFTQARNRCKTDAFLSANIIMPWGCETRHMCHVP